QAQDDVATPYRMVADVDALRRTGQYAVLTPAQFVDELRAAPFAFALLPPMCGGMPIELDRHPAAHRVQERERERSRPELVHELRRRQDGVLARTPKRIDVGHHAVRRGDVVLGL